jgi:hypothetical protein
MKRRARDCPRREARDQGHHFFGCGRATPAPIVGLTAL